MTPPIILKLHLITHFDPERLFLTKTPGRYRSSEVFLERSCAPGRPNLEFGLFEEKYYFFVFFFNLTLI